MESKELKLKSEQLRLNLLKLINTGKTGHTGGDLSVLNVLTVLYNNVLNVDPKNPKMTDRDRFILSKGHCAEALYVVLCDKGFIDQSELDAYGTCGAHLGGHPDVTIPGVEINTGALGHGLAAGVGMALAAKMDKRNARAFVVMGDGEQAEGSIYEAAMAGNKYHLDNLVAILDRNGLQISGPTETVMAHEDLAARIRSFNWNVISVNGNDIEELDAAFEAAKQVTDRPTCIIANTVKGFGGGEIMENKAGWHHKVPTDAEYESISAELKRRKEAAEHE